MYTMRSTPAAAAARTSTSQVPSCAVAYVLLPDSLMIPTRCTTPLQPLAAASIAAASL